MCLVARVVDVLELMGEELRGGASELHGVADLLSGEENATLHQFRELRHDRVTVHRGRGDLLEKRKSEL